MINGKRCIGIIPARGGSKRLPGKNTMMFYGKPLIFWSIEAAIKSEFIDCVVVSTDDEETIDISKKFGASIPFVRPDIISTDSATSIDVVRHAIDFLKQSGDCYDYVVVLQPTSPLRTSEHVDDAIHEFVDKNANCVVSVTKAGHPTEWINEVDDSGSLKNFILDDKKKSQDYSDKYILNGAIYIIKESLISEYNSMIIPKKGFAYIMKQKDSIDIDNFFDLQVAECFMKIRYA